jgi:enoyl-CoA hydratase/carnithine racemase
MVSEYTDYEYLQIAVDDGIATVTLNRPEKLNAPNSDAELISIWADLAADDRVRAIVLTGAGRAFCAGGDLQVMLDNYRSEAGLRFYLELIARARRMVDAMLSLQLPVVAAVNGDAIGLGATLALLCDVTVMAADARIGDPHVKLGLVAGDGGAVIWPLLIGPHRAKEFLLRGNLLTGEQAAAVDLVNHVVARDDVVPRALELAREIAANPIWAVRYTKMAINKWLRQQAEVIFDASIAFESLSAFTDDHGEAMLALQERRPPRFTGT